MRPDHDRTSLYHLADRVLNRQLGEKLCRWRDAGVSLRSIQALLEDELEVRIALETVRRWVKFAETGDEANGAAA